MGHTECQGGRGCVQGWLGVCWSCFVPVCTQGVCVCSHVCALEQGHAGSLGKHLWIRVEGHCVCPWRVCG